MIYIFCAFEAEARAVIDAYGLKKKIADPWTIFASKEIELVISGMGQENAKKAAQYLLSTYTIKEKDLLLNIGICAAQDDYTIGELLEIEHLHHGNKAFHLRPQPSTIKKVSCFSVNKAQSRHLATDIAEMEAFGLYETLKDHFQPYKISFLKIVSDNFQPFIPKKSFVIGLIQAHIKEIKKHIEHLQGDNDAT